jgi:hypothetical protein
VNDVHVGQVAREVGSRAAGAYAGRMAGRRTNLALLLLVPAAAVTGLLTFVVGSGPVALVVVTHALVGLAVLVLSPWKSAIVRRGLRRHRPGATCPSC